MRRAPSIVAFVAFALGCSPSIPRTTSLHVASDATDPPYARVTIDDQPVGALITVVKRGVALPPGKHRITIEADGFLPWDRDVDAGEGGGVVDVDVKLVKQPD